MFGWVLTTIQQWFKAEKNNLSTNVMEQLSTFCGGNNFDSYLTLYKKITWMVHKSNHITWNYKTEHKKCFVFCFIDGIRVSREREPKGYMLD